MQTRGAGFLRQFAVKTNYGILPRKPLIYLLFFLFSAYVVKIFKKIGIKEVNLLS